ncbi:kelch repeat and BTB domain-containing protein 12-like isoform X1 [Branchiostoma floridae x Branchiostoma japonicum]
MATADQEASSVRPRSYQDESYPHGFLGTVGDLQKAGVLQDVVIEVEDRRFPCHRLVLSAASPYFRAMFTSDMAESRQKTVVLQGLDADMFGEILSYIYSGTLHVSLDKVQPLYQAADLLQLDYVRDTCSSYMAMNVKRSTCVDLYKFADVFSLDFVRRRSMQSIHHHFAKVASSEEFCSLSVNQLTEIISHDELDVKEETTVWEAVVRWVQHSREDRLHHLPSILPHIRFNLLTSDDTAAILDHPLVREDPGSSEVIRNVVQEGNPDLKLRLGMTTEMVLLTNLKYMFPPGTTYISTYTLLFMNPRQGKYISCSYDSDILSRAEAMTVTSDNNIYILSREVTGTDQLSLFQYSHVDNVWERAGIFPVSELQGPGDGWICDHELFEIDGSLYYIVVAKNRYRVCVVGMRKYDRHAHEWQGGDPWQECSQLQLDGVTGYTLQPCGPFLYFLSGPEVHHYDPSQNRWCKRTPQNVISEVFTSVAMGTEIFCTDFDFSQTMVYDTVSDSWQTLQGWQNPENATSLDIGPTLFVLENQLHVHVLLEAEESSEEESAEYQVYVYDRSADAWRDLEAALPDGGDLYVRRGPHWPVARIYLPYLMGAQKH